MTLSQLDRHLANWMQSHGHACLRLGLGIVFVWFGAPKLVPGLSPAEDLVRATVTWCDPDWFVPMLGIAEVLIGVCLMSRTWLRLGLLLMAGHMVGTVLPLFTLPEIAWKAFPVATLEGQYILKNMVLIGAAIVLGGGAAPRTSSEWRGSTELVRRLRRGGRRSRAETTQDAFTLERTCKSLRTK